MESRKEDTPENLFLDFQKACEDSSSIYSSAWRLYDAYNASTPDFSADMRDMLAEHVILRLFATWECFLEDIFTAYMLGYPSTGGIKPARYVTPKDKEHALNLIRNVRQYPDWADIDTVLLHAHNFFMDGGPFEILKARKANINAIRKIRNAIAHASGKAAANFEKLVREKVGYLPEPISPAIFLCRKLDEGEASLTYCEHYINFLRSTAEALADYHPEK